MFKFLFPLLGGLGLFFVLIITLHDSASPDYGSGASVFGVGLVLVLGLGLILIGIVFMLLMRARQPAFFKNETLKHEAAHNMKQHEHLEFDERVRWSRSALRGHELRPSLARSSLPRGSLMTVRPAVRTRHHVPRRPPVRSRRAGHATPTPTW